MIKKKGVVLFVFPHRTYDLDICRIASLSFLPENFQFLEVKFSIYLNRRVFVMTANEVSRRVMAIVFSH